MSFLIGVLIGGIIVYLWLQSKVQETRRVEQTLRKQLAQSESESRNRAAQADNAEHLEAQAATCQTELQTTTQELRQTTAQLATAEAQINSLRAQLAAAAESEAAAAKAQPVADVSEALSMPVRPEQPVTDMSAALFTPVRTEYPVAEVPTEIAAPVQAEYPFADAPAEIPASVQPDDLTKIEGIGPKVSQVLNDNGIVTFAQLASATANTLREILQAAGPRFKMMEPESWPEQARLAANGAWDDLQRLQDELDGGKYRR